MLTKQTKIVTKTVVVEEAVDVYNLQLTKDQLVELAALLGNCIGYNTYSVLHSEVKKDVNLARDYKKREAEFSDALDGSTPELKHL